MSGMRTARCRPREALRPMGGNVGMTKEGIAPPGAENWQVSPAVAGHFHGTSFSGTTPRFSLDRALNGAGVHRVAAQPAPP